MTEDLVTHLRAENDRLQGRVSQLERELHQSVTANHATAAQLDDIFSILPDLYFRVDDVGLILDYRAGHAGDLYVPPEVFRDKRFEDVLPPDIAAAYSRAIAEALATRRTVQIEYSLPMAEGDDWFDARLLAIRERELIVFVRKVTAQHRDREALQRLNAGLEERVASRTEALNASNATLRLFQALADNAPDAIVLTRPDRAQVYANPAACALFELDPEGEAEVSIDLFASMFGEAEREALRTAGKAVTSDVTRCRRRDGGTFHARATAFLIPQDGERALYAYLVRDVTAEIEAEADRASFQQRLIEVQRDALRELSAPVIPIAAGIVAVPLIGRVDQERLAQLAETLLGAVERHAAEIVLVDATGVPDIDEDAALALVRAARAVGLLGARLLLTGIRPEVARTLVSMEADLGGIVTLRSLEQGIAYALQLKR